MSKYQHTRQHMPVHGFKSASTARKLIALSQGPAPLVLNATVPADETLTEAVHARISFCKQIIGGIALDEWQAYFLVRSSKFTTRYYVVAKVGTQLVCSSKEQGVQARCLQVVEQYRTAAQAVMVA